MARQICVDVSIVLKLVLAEQHSDLARRLWLNWIDEEAELIAPPLFMFEGVSAIYDRPTTYPFDYTTI